MTIAEIVPSAPSSSLFRRSILRRAAGAALLLLCATMGKAAATETDDYRLTAGDVLSFDFLDDALPAEQLSVSGNGTVNVPLIGAFQVGGLTVPEALSSIRKALIEHQIYIDPKVALSVTTFRPVFVLGDVKAPGAFPYQPLLTVEQAVALAGGQLAGGVTNEDRVVTRARMQGQLQETDVEVGREAVAAARLTAQLAGRPDISEEDLPAKARTIVTSALIATLLPTERQILSAEDRAYVTRRDQLTEAVREVKGALSNLDQLAAKQKDVITSALGEVERARKLNTRGLKTLTDLSGVERDARMQEAHLLEVFNQMSTTRRELGELQRQLAELTDKRTRQALIDLQTHIAEIERLLAARASTEQQIVLLGSLVAEAEQRAGAVVFHYRIRRKVDGAFLTREVQLDDAIRSGDTLLVSVEQPGSSLAAASLTPAAVEVSQP